jgi:hypothetical protein
MATKKRGFRRVRNVFPRTVKASKGAAKKVSSFFQKAKKSLKRLPSWLNSTTSKLVRKVTIRRRRH